MLPDRIVGHLVRRRLRAAARRRRAAGPSARSSFDGELFQAQEDLIRRYATGSSFADIGCLWGVHGGCAFLAEAAGATAVTAMDKWPPDPEYLERHERTMSKVRYVQADLIDPATASAVGLHDVVWCSGVMYHTPEPTRALVHLMAMTKTHLIVGTKGIPSVPGLPCAAVYFPGLSGRERSALAEFQPGLATDFDPALFVVNWFWGFSPECLAAIVQSTRQFELVETVLLPFGNRHDDVYSVFRRIS